MKILLTVITAGAVLYVGVVFAILMQGPPRKPPT
jgi:hypothetical protein